MSKDEQVAGQHATEPRVIVALDYADVTAARDFVARVSPDLCRLKVGKELFTRAGPAFVAELVRDGFGVFLDLKYYDIPHTVAGACRAATDLGVWMLNVHASGGPRMLDAARAAVGESAVRPWLIAVTLLTSFGRDELAAIGWNGEAQANVDRLATMAQVAGLDGVVCSPLEAARLRARFGAGFMLVTPGVRPVGSAQDDQTRVATPAAAIANGANYLVIGRPVTQADDPVRALLTINSEISALTAG